MRLKLVKNEQTKLPKEIIMRVPFVVFKDRGDLIEGDKSNFLNTVEEVRAYTDGRDVAYFVNVRGVTDTHEAPVTSFKHAVKKAEDIRETGTARENIFISVAFQEFATADDIDF